MVHHVLLQQDPRSEDLAADVADTFLNSVGVAHVIEQRSLSRADLRADMALEGFTLGLSYPMNVAHMHSIPDGRLEVFAAELKGKL